MPVVATTRYGQAEDALTLARSLMNDPNATVFTDALLFPFLNSAYRSLQRELAENGVSVLTVMTTLALTLNASTGITNTEISDLSNPQLPTDCLVPHELWEQAASNPTDVFVPMEKITAGLPNLQPSQYLRIWEWREDKINLVGATQAVTVQLRYEKVLPALVLGTDPILIPSVTDALAFGVAAMAARARGNRELAVDLAEAREDEREKVVARYVRPEQFKGRRRKPYGYRRRIIYL